MSAEPSAKRSKPDESDATMGREDLEAVDALQHQLDELNDKAGEEIVQIEQKYNALRSPIYTKRSEAIKNVPNFWATAFINHPQLSQAIAEIEEPLLTCIDAVEVEEFADIKSGYRFKFQFKKNDYIENEVIVKDYNLSSQTPHTKVTEVVWKPGSNLLEQLSMNRHPVPSDSHSFFEWLFIEGDPLCDDISEIIKDDIWPNPVQYFLLPDVDEEEEEIEENGEAEE